MSDSPLRIVPTEPAEPPQEEPTRDEIAELRHLLIEPEQIQIDNILERLNNPRVRARELSRALPEAIRLRAKEDETLKEALTPTIVTAFQSSIKKDPRPVAEAISPLMGPAIRRAISLALNGLIQSFDQALKYSLSWQGMKWRLEALRTGKSFAEVVLYHTLVYRVEQVFLIHKHTGLLLQHAAAGSVSTKDADIVSGMMSAIQDAIRNFARDSFGAGHDNHLDKLDLGDLEVWFEQGQYAVLAAVIRGNAPESLRNDYFAPSIEAIHLEMRESLHSFDGDTAPFEMIRHHLEICLQSRYQTQADEKRRKTPTYIWVLLTLVLGSAAIWAFFTWRDQRRWDDYIDKLRGTPGIVVTETGTRNGKRFVAGLRDPLTTHPDEILRKSTLLDPKDVISQWQRYQALDPEFVIERAKNILKPPSGVELTLNGGILTASGTASHQWIDESRNLVLAIPGIDGFDNQNLIDEDLKEPETIRRRIEQRVLLFLRGSTQLVPGQDRELKDLISDIKKLTALAPAVSRAAQFQIIGHTDTEGDENTNVNLSRDRATRISSLLTARGIDGNPMTVIGVGEKEPLRAETNPADRQFNRSVSFKVTLLDSRRGTGERK